MYQIVTNGCLEYFKNKQLVIYGAGNVARIVMEKFLYNNIDILCLTVTERGNNPYFLMRKPVICMERLTNINHNEAVVIVAAFEKVQADITDRLEKSGFRQIYAMRDALYYEWLEELANNNTDTGAICLQRYVEPYIKTVSDLCREYDIDEENTLKYVETAYTYLKKDELDIARLVVVLGTKCSLRCRDCNNLLPYYQIQEDFDKEQIINSLINITDNARSILRCELIGGEPFLSKNLDDVLEWVIKNETIKSVEITTNGTITPNEKTIPLLQNPMVLVRISDYGELVDKNKIITFLNEHKIRYEVIGSGKWVSAGGVESRQRKETELRKQYKACSAGYYCKTLYKGKIYACARAASLFDLGFMKEEEYIEASNGFSVKEMRDFIFRDFSVACDYCDMATKDSVHVDPAIQINSCNNSCL